MITREELIQICVDGVVHHTKWHLVKIEDEYYAEKEVTLPLSDIKRKILFRDINRDIMSLGKDEKWAKEWIDDKNEIDGYL